MSAPQIHCRTEWLSLLLIFGAQHSQQFSCLHVNPSHAWSAHIRVRRHCAACTLPALRVFQEGQFWGIPGIRSWRPAHMSSPPHGRLMNASQNVFMYIYTWHHDYLAIWQGCAALRLVTAFEVANLLQGLRSRVEEHDGRIIACTMTTLPFGKAARQSNVYITAFEVAKLIRGLRSRVEEYDGRIVIWHHDHLAIW